MDKKEKVVTKDANGKKEIRNRHGVTKAEKGHLTKPEYPQRDMSESSNLRMLLITT